MQLSSFLDYIRRIKFAINLLDFIDHASTIVKPARETICDQGLNKSSTSCHNVLNWVRSITTISNVAKS